MSEILNFSLEKDGIVFLLCVMVCALSASVLVLWKYVKKMGISNYARVLKKIDNMESHILEGVIPTLNKICQLEANNQGTLKELRLNQLMFMHSMNSSNPIKLNDKSLELEKEVFRLIQNLDEKELKKFIRHFEEERA